MLKNIIELSRQLISVPSVTSDVTSLKKVINLASATLNEFKPQYFEKNNYPSTFFSNKSTNRFKIILNAHLDVVAAKSDQFFPLEKDGKLFGRGAIDMKAAAAVQMLLFSELANKVSYPLGLQLVTDEETGGFNGTKYQVEKGIRADFVIAGEPTDFGINNKAKGILWAKITTRGKAAHAAYPWNGENAITSMADVINHIKKQFPVPQKESWVTTANIASIESSNKTFNKVPDDCTLSIDIRYIPEDEDTVQEKLVRELPKNTEYKILTKEPAQITDENNKYVQALRKSVKTATKKDSAVIVKHGGSDIRHFNAVGCTGVTFGPIGAGLHTDEEWVDVQSLQDYYDILKNFLLSIKA